MVSLGGQCDKYESCVYDHACELYADCMAQMTQLHALIGQGRIKMTDSTGENDNPGLEEAPREPYSYTEIEGALNEPVPPEAVSQFKDDIAEARRVLLSEVGAVEDRGPQMQYNFQGVDTTGYVRTLAQFMAAQTRFLSSARSNDHLATYNRNLEEYSLAQGMMIGACQQLLHQLGVI